MVAPPGVGEDLKSALKHLPASPGLRAAGMEQPQQPGRAALWRGGALPMASEEALLCQERQAGKMEKGGVSRVAKEQEMHLRLCQISATRGRRQGRSGIDTGLHPGIQEKGKLPALLCSTDFSSPHGLETNILISAPQICYIM